jgi:uncharacterized protein (TIRG00374 family)
MFTASRLQTIRTGIVCSLALAFVVLVAISLYADLPSMLLALAHFRWAFLPLILSLTLFNYCFRFVKWQYYLQRLKITLPRPASLLIFLSGLSMAITPGKVGELLKSYLLKRSTGEPISRTAPIIVAERLSDGLAMLLLAMSGLVMYRFGWELLLSLLAVGLIVVLIVQHRGLSLKLLAVGERLPLLSRLARPLRLFYESAYTLLCWSTLLPAVLIGLLSWSGECLALYCVFLGLGLPADAALLLKATFILAVASLIGSASGLPGGLGSADGSLLGLIRWLVSPSAAVGGAATLLIRFCTLWFGLALGMSALLVLRFTKYRSLFTPEYNEERKVLVYARRDPNAVQNEAEDSLRLLRASAPLSDRG